MPNNLDERCPHCGAPLAPKPRPENKLWVILSIIVLGVFMATAWAFIFSTNVQ